MYSYRICIDTWKTAYLYLQSTCIFDWIAVLHFVERLIFPETIILLSVYCFMQFVILGSQVTNPNYVWAEKLHIVCSNIFKNNNKTYTTW